MKKILLFLLFLAGFSFYFRGDSEETVKKEEVEHKVLKIEEVKKESISPEPIKKVQPVKKTLKFKEVDPDFHSLDEQGNMYITKLMNDGEYLTFQGDLIYDKSENLDDILKRRVLKAKKPRKWNKGLIPYVIGGEITQASEIEKAIKYLEEKTNIRFKKRDGEEDFLTFKKGKVNCYSSLGRIGGEQFISLSSLCAQREILHELMHTLGFLHEHSREDRDDYIEVVWRNISEENQVQFKKMKNDFVDITSRPFDYKSIMLYPSQSFSMYPGEYSILKLNGDIIHPQYSLLSQEDILRVNKAYPFKR